MAGTRYITGMGTNEDTTIKVPANITIDDEGWVYRWTGNSGECIGRLDDFSQSVSIEGKPHLSRYVRSAQEGLDYIIQNAR